jgi:hypothetical protein
MAAVFACLPAPAGGVEVFYVGAVRGGLSAPTSLDASADQIAALQPYSGQILVLTPGGIITRRIDVAGETHGLARLSASVYLYCDRERGRVMAVDLTDGRQWEFLGFLADPADIVVSGSECHVLESGARRIVTTDIQGNVTARLALAAATDPPLGAPAALAYDALRDAFHVFDQPNSRVHVFARTGSHLGSYCSFGAEGGTVTRGGALVCDADGYVYIVDRYQGRIAVFDPEWRFVIDVETGALAGERLIVPTGIAVDVEGTIYVASTEDNCIHVFYLDKTADPAGTLSASPLYPTSSGAVPADDATLATRLIAAVKGGSTLEADFRIFDADGPATVLAEAFGVAAVDVGRDDQGRLVGTATWRPGDVLKPGAEYRWQARARAEGRVGIWSDPVSFSTQAPAVRYNLEANYPNPFNPRTTIAFTVPAVGWAELEVFDLKGSRVWSENFRNLSAGRHTVTWEGVDHAGTAVASGVYFYRLRSEGFEQTRKMVLVK